MELKQMEYLIAAAELKSLNKAADALYTTQPNVSKVLKSLEKELNAQILIRSPKGITLTSFGEEICAYARNMIQNARMIDYLAQNATMEHLNIASYPSNMIARLLTDFYKQYETGKLHIEFLTGSAEEVVDLVAEGQSDVGVVYLAKKQEAVFNRLLEKKNMKFHVLKECELCLYAGPLHPYYNCESIDFEELKYQKFVQGKKDYFSMTDHMDYISLGAIRTDQLNHVVHTNSDHLMLDMLLYSDLCSVGLDFMYPHYCQYDIRTIRINDCERCLLVGYVTAGTHRLSVHDRQFIRKLKTMFQ